eukprot:c28936_g1_i3 orf=522-2567(-)
MEARNQNGGFGFPSCVRSFPRAIRSSRIRQECLQRPNCISKGMGYFELLATVAGQLLQDSSKGEGQMADQTSDYKYRRTKSKEMSSAGELSLSSSENHVGILLCSLHKVDDGLVASDGLRNEEDMGRPSTDSGGCMEKEASEPQCMHSCATGGLESHLGTLLHALHNEDGVAEADKGGLSTDFGGMDISMAKPQFCESCPVGSVEAKFFHGNVLLDPSVVPPREGSDISALQKDNVCDAPLMKCTPDGDLSCGQGLMQAICMAQVDEMASSIMDREATLGNLDDSFIHFKGLDLSKGKWQAGLIGKIPDGLVLDDEIPPPLTSSGSSGEAPTCMERNMYEMHFELPLEREKVETQEICCSTVRENDQDSSESTVAEPVFMESGQVSQMKGSSKRGIMSGIIRNGASGDGFKRKPVELAGESAKDLNSYGSGIWQRAWKRTHWTPSKKQTDQVSSSIISDSFVTANYASSLDFIGGDGEPPASAAKLRSAKAASVAFSPTSSVPSLKFPGKKSSEQHVKVSIKSFAVPELSIDLPESATVANLKRAVMEAAMNVFGGGLCVRVLLQGKKICDENTSLVEVSTSCSGKLDSLGFMLEPNATPASPTTAEDPVLVLSHVGSCPASRYPVFAVHGEASQSTMRSHTGKSNLMTDVDKATSTGVTFYVSNMILLAECKEKKTDTDS